MVNLIDEYGTDGPRVDDLLLLSSNRSSKASRRRDDCCYDNNELTWRQERNILKFETQFIGGYFFFFNNNFFTIHSSCKKR